MRSLSNSPQAAVNPGDVKEERDDCQTGVYNYVARKAFFGRSTSLIVPTSTKFIKQKPSLSLSLGYR